MTESQPGHRPSASLIAEATKRSGIIWIRVPGGERACPAWHIWQAVPGTAPAGAAYLVTGPGEQPVPGLGGTGRVTVTVPSDRAEDGVVTWTAQVSRVEPGSGEWDQVIAALVAGRLNAPAATGGASPARRWARSCAVFRLAPAVTEPQISH